MLTPEREFEIREELAWNINTGIPATWSTHAVRDLLAEIDRLRGQLKDIADAVDHWEGRSEYDSIKVYNLILAVREILEPEPASAPTE